VLTPALAATRRGVVGIAALDRAGIVGITDGDLREGQPLATAEIALAQPRQDNQREIERLRDRLRRLPRPQ